MNKDTLIKYLKKQIKFNNKDAKFMIGEKVRIKKNASSFQIGLYKDNEGDEWKEVVYVNYGDYLKDNKNKIFRVIHISTKTPFITPKTKYIRHYTLSDGKRKHHIWENELIKVD